MIHLDTNFVVRGFIRGTAEDAALRRWITARVLLGVSAPAWAEFLCGPVSEDQVRAATDVVGEPLVFGREAAALAADMFNHAGRRRGSLVDCMIAAVAVRHGAQLATANQDDFARFGPLGLVLATR